jgi:hypothetical protein
MWLAMMIGVTSLPAVTGAGIAFRRRHSPAVP